MHSSGIKSIRAWRKKFNEKGLPKGIPKHPDYTYKNKGWINWGDFLGTGRIANQKTGWSIQKVKKVLRSIIETKVIYINVQNKI